MKGYFKLLLLASILISCVLTQNAPSGTTPITLTKSAVSASPVIYMDVLSPKCLEQLNTNSRSYPSGHSMENLIALIEKLESRLYNSTDTTLLNNIYGAEKLARILLRRFRFDGIDDINAPTYKRQRDQLLDEINTAFLGKPETDPNYYFPDYVYTDDELCSLFFMLSHNIVNATITNRGRSYAPQVFRGKRQAYNYNRRQYNAPTSGPNNGFVVSPFLGIRNTTLYAIKEEGVVSFRGNKNEAIATARVLIGIIAGLSTSVKTSVRDVLAALGVTSFDPNYDKPIDPVLAMTLGDLWGTGSVRSTDDKTYMYGISGEWSSTTCTSHYGLTSVPATSDKFDLVLKTSKGTKAEIRGGIDGYLIGKSLKAMGSGVGDVSRLRLSTILRSYYSRPRLTTTNSLTVSYCDRTSQLTNDLQNTATLYNAIQSFKSDVNPSSVPSEFQNALQSAQQIESSGFSDYCNRPSGTLDKNAPCETPSDVIFVIDGQSSDKLQISGDIVSSISGNLNNIRRQGGTVSIFFNSMGKNNVNPNIQLPSGPGDWPLTAASFNSTNTGCSSCRINDFTQSPPQPAANTGKLFLYLNQTLFNYEWWTPRTNYSTVPSKSVVLIDLGSVTAAPESGQDRNDYNNYKDQLRYRHRDVRYLSVSQNQDLFKDLLRDENDKETPGAVGSPNLQLGSTLAKKICDNPATFQYNACNERKSENIQYVGYVTPGYKQNWAMYPEFFLKSFNIRFSFKAEDGSIKVCYDRTFPPERQDEWYCKELAPGEEKIFDISNPCKGRSFSSCDPFYFTIWGKDKTTGTQCLDERCASLDQIKYTVTHSGVQCSSSNHLLPSTTFQVITFFISAILYLFLNNNNNKI